jgi:hypothetical protein
MGFFDPKNSDERDFLIDGHPVVEAKVKAITNTIQGVYARVRESVWLGHPSICFDAPPRMGKTTAATMVRFLLEQEFPKKYALQVSCDMSEKDTIINTLANAIGLLPKYRESQSQLRHRVINHLECEILARGGAHVVLILDELQSLTLDQFKVLQMMQNHFKDSEITLTSVGFAQADISKRISSFRVAGENAIVARFLSQRVRFEGCDSVTWLEELLNDYDSTLFYPSESECSYTQFFVPLAFDSGFRLGSYASSIYASVRQAVTASSRTKQVPIPTEHLFRSIQNLLIRASSDDRANLKIFPKDINEAIERSMMAEFVQSSKRESVK